MELIKQKGQKGSRTLIDPRRPRRQNLTPNLKSRAVGTTGRRVFATATDTHPRNFCERRIEAVEVENVGAEVAGDGGDAAAALGAVGADLEEHTYVTSAMDGGGEEGPPKANEVREVV